MPAYRPAPTPIRLGAIDVPPGVDLASVADFAIRWSNEAPLSMSSVEVRRIHDSTGMERGSG